MRASQTPYAWDQVPLVLKTAEAKARPLEVIFRSAVMVQRTFATDSSD